MKTSDIQMTPQELATLQGLDADLGQMVRAPLMLKTAVTGAVTKPIALPDSVLATVTKQLEQQGVTAPPPPAPSFMDKWKELMKNPWYWVGIAAVVGGGAWLLMRRRKAVQQVAAVETLSLEGMYEAPKRKRRKSKRKSKK